MRADGARPLHTLAIGWTVEALDRRNRMTVPAGAATGAPPSGSQSRLRLIHCVFIAGRHPTSMTEAFARMCTRARERGWEFEVVAPEETRDSAWTRMLADRGAVIRHLPPGTKRELAEGFGTILDAAPGPAILHTHLTGYDVPVGLAARGRPQTSVFWHHHSFLVEGLVASLRMRLKYMLFRRVVDRRVAQSENIRDGLIKAGVPRKRIVMFNSGIDASLYPVRTPEQRAAERERMGIPVTAKLLLHFGWDWEIKGTDRFLEAVRILLDGGTEIVALVNRGGDETRDGARRLGLEDVVEIGGLVDDTRPLYVAADCMVAPSRGEGMPFSLVEALATGVPVVASDLPGHRYLAERIPSCRVVDPEPAVLAEAIAATLARSPEEAASEAAASHDWIASNLNVDTVVEGLFAEYDRALAERGVSA